MHLFHPGYGENDMSVRIKISHVALYNWINRKYNSSCCTLHFFVKKLVVPIC